MSQALRIGDVLAGLERPPSPRTGRPVWRNSYYEGTIESRIWRPFMGGNLRGAKRRIGAILKCARELDRKTRRERQRATPGAKNGILGQVALDVLDALYNRFLDYRTGALEPAIMTIAEAVGHSYSAVHRALKRLREAGFLQWVRRTRPSDSEGEAGPQIEQISNAYALLVPTKIEAMVGHLVGKAPVPNDVSWDQARRRAEFKDMVAGLTAKDFHADFWRGDSLAGETLAKIAAAIDRREEQSREFSKGGVTGGV